MTRAWNLSVAIAGLCGALLATPAAAEPNNPCAAVIGELRQVAADEKGSVSHMRGLQDDISHHLQDILTAQNYIRKYENVIHGLNDSGLTIFDKSLGMPDLKDAQEHLAEQQGRIQNLVSGMSKIQAELAVTSERLTAARNRHNALRQQLASPNCRTAGQRPVSPTDTASTPSGNPATASTANTNAPPELNYVAPGLQPSASPPAGTAPASTKPPGEISYVAPGLTPSPRNGVPATAASPPSELNYVAPGLQNKPPPRTQKQPRVVRQNPPVRPPPQRTRQPWNLPAPPSAPTIILR